MTVMDVKIYFRADLRQNHYYASRALNVKTTSDGKWLIVRKKNSIDMFPERDISAVYVTNISEEEDNEG